MNWSYFFITFGVMILLGLVLCGSMAVSTWIHHRWPQVPEPAFYMGFWCTVFAVLVGWYMP